MTEGARVLDDLAAEGVGESVVPSPLRGVEGPLEPKVEDRFARELELAAEERHIESRIDAGIGERRDRRGRADGRADPFGARVGPGGEKRGEILHAQVLDELIALAVVGEETRHRDALFERGASLHPPPPRVGLFGRIDDAEHALPAAEDEAQVAAAPDVAR